MLLCQHYNNIIYGGKTDDYSIYLFYEDDQGKSRFRRLIDKENHLQQEKSASLMGAEKVWSKLAGKI